MTETRLWAVVCLLSLVAAVGVMAAGLRRVYETGYVDSANGHYMTASVLTGVMFVALAAMDHYDTPTHHDSHHESRD